MKNPTIKLATTASLNDPFEKELSEDLAKNLTEKLLDLPYFKNKNEKAIGEVRQELISLYRNYSKNYGIVSLTETHRNLLMWAHYGSSHRGVCIGYDINMFSTLSELKTELEDDGILEFKPQRVKYDSQRFDIEFFHDGNRTIDILMEAIRTKGDEWIYEKEHRCIIPFEHSDRITILKDNDKEPVSIFEKLGELETLEYITRDTSTVNEDTYSYIINKNDSKKSLKYVASDIAHHEKVVMLKDISIKAIDSIYLGSQHPKDAVEKTIELFRGDTERYGHIKLYKYRANDNRFSLDLIPLVNCKIQVELSEIIKNNILDVSFQS